MKIGHLMLCPSPSAVKIPVSGYEIRMIKADVMLKETSNEKENPNMYGVIGGLRGGRSVNCGAWE